MEIIINPTGEEIEQEIAITLSGDDDHGYKMLDNIFEYPDGDDMAIPFSWWLKKEPDMDDRLEEAGISLEEMFSKFEIFPLRIYEAREDMLFLARFEAIKFEAEFEHEDAFKIISAPDDPLMFIDFMDGMPIGAAELIGVVGELSSRKEDVEVLAGKEQSVPTMHELFFDDIDFEDSDHVAYSHLWVDRIKADNPYQMLAKNLVGEPLPMHSHWWCRFFLVDEESEMQWPVPGEFLSFCPRVWPTMVWGKQRSNPFMFSGNWIETVYYTNAKVLEVLEETEKTPYPRYRIQYRKYVIIAKPTDFAEHQVDERVTILRLSDKDSWTWKDLTEFNTEEWVIAPVSFYNDIANEEE